LNCISRKREKHRKDSLKFISEKRGDFFKKIEKKGGCRLEAYISSIKKEGGLLQLYQRGPSDMMKENAFIFQGSFHRKGVGRRGKKSLFKEKYGSRRKKEADV